MEIYYLEPMKNTLLCLPVVCLSFLLQAQQPTRYDVLIHEIMASPPASSPLLPDCKYVELFNASGITYDLFEWKLSDGNNTAVIGAHFLLEPGKPVVLCSSANAKLFPDTVPVIGLSRFPTLRVNGDLVWLLTNTDMLMHAVPYSRSWYGNKVKSAGGWSLEMADRTNPCGGAGNWQASVHPSGGTPGAPNSVQANKKDNDEPRLLRAYATDSIHLTLVFDESLDSQYAANAGNYKCSEEIIIRQAIPLAPLFNIVQLKLEAPLRQNKVYTIEVKNLPDCSGNIISGISTARTGWGQFPEERDLVINEILFNPPEDGADYVELYNRSRHIINAKNLVIANRNSGGALNTIKPLTAEDILIFPGDYVVISEDAAAIQRHYLVKNPDAVIELATMPSFPNTSGTAVLLNTQGTVIDEVNYSEKWHFELVVNPKGVALERIDYNRPGQDRNNWHSAASGVGYGTPGYQNSQYRAETGLKGEVSVSPRVFSPDGDGRDDFLLIHYQFPEPGYVCNITVFDVYGRTVRFLVRNGLCGTTGYFKWNGQDEKNIPAGTGIYVVLTEVFNLQGKIRRYKHAATLARMRR